MMSTDWVLFLFLTDPLELVRRGLYFLREGATIIST